MELRQKRVWGRVLRKEKERNYDEGKDKEKGKERERQEEVKEGWK